MTVFQNAKGQGYGGIEARRPARPPARRSRRTVVWIPYELVTPDNYKNYMKK